MAIIYIEGTLYYITVNVDYDEQDTGSKVNITHLFSLFLLISLIPKP